MTNTILILNRNTTEQIRLVADDISQYESHGDGTRIQTKSGEDIVVEHSVDDIDNALTESFFMMKRVQ